MEKFQSTDVFSIFGRRGSGKSHLARRVSEAYPRKVIFDSLGEYSDCDGIIVYGFEEFGQKIIELENSPAFTLIYHFNVERDNHSAEFDQALRVLWHRGNIFVCVEEIQLFSSPHQMPMWLRQCLLTGRHRNLGLAFTTQRPGECHKTIISQCNRVFSGSLHEKNDVEYCRAVLGDAAFLLPGLKEREFLYFSPGHPIIMTDSGLSTSAPISQPKI